jgi:hypothetical protein
MPKPPTRQILTVLFALALAVCLASSVQATNILI